MKEYETENPEKAFEADDEKMGHSDGGDMMIVRETPAYHAEANEYKKKTLEDYYSLPDDVRAELIDGRLYNMSAPSANHQLILSALTIQIGLFLQRSKRKCKGFPAPFDVRLNRDDTTIVQPDYMIICDKSKYEGGIRCEGAPDLAVEIVSPSTQKRDYGVKLRKYKDAGVREYWIVDPLKMRIIVHTFEQDAIPVVYSFDDTVESRIYPGLKIDFSEIKAELIGGVIS